MSKNGAEILREQDSTEVFPDYLLQYSPQDEQNNQTWLQDSLGYLDKIKLAVLKADGTESYFYVYLHPTNFQNYYNLPPSFVSSDDLYFYASDPNRLRTAIQTIIQYAIAQWSAQNGSSYPAHDLSVWVGSNGNFFISFGVTHNPVGPYLNIASDQPAGSLYFPDGKLATDFNLGAGATSPETFVQLPADCSPSTMVGIGYLHDLVDTGVKNWKQIPLKSAPTQTYNRGNTPVTCTGTIETTSCDTPIAICTDGNCAPCGSTYSDTPICDEGELTTLNQELASLDADMQGMTPSNLTIPTILYQLRFCNGENRWVFREELSKLTVKYNKAARIQVTSLQDKFRLTDTLTGSSQIGGLSTLLTMRPGNSALEVDPVPPATMVDGGNGGSGGGDGDGDDDPSDVGFQVSYFVHDHLGNTRVLYHTTLNCAEDEVNYVLEHVLDYYPYGKVLREHVNCDEARYLTTHHERDKETGYDYRGARFYDSDIGRFLSIDPLAEFYPSFSLFSYVAGNPISIIDPDGRAWSEANKELADLYGLFGNSNESYKENSRLFQKEEVSFKELWSNYPSYFSPIKHKDPKSGKDIFSNHCAINCSDALHKSGVELKRFNGTKCWHCPEEEPIHAIRAQELSNWLINTAPIEGMLPPKFLSGENFEEYVEGKTGIIFFKDYWQRSSESGNTRTGDHIDLWKKNKLASIGWFWTAVRRNAPQFSEDYLDMSDLRKSEQVIFWEIK